jgi:arginyl-tRNA synthetase
MSALTEIRDALRGALAEYTDDVESALGMIRAAQDPKFGDFQANFAMPLAKQAGVSPRDLAQEIVAKINVPFCEAPEIAGPGFINLRLKDDWLVAKANSLSRDERLGHKPVKTKTIIIDYSSPNVAKPTHVGHLRSSVIGHTLDQVLRFVGHDVKSDNHIGDWGTQFGMIIFGYKNFLDATAYEQQPVAELTRIYRLVNSLADYHTAVKKLPGAVASVATLETQISQLEASDADPKSKKKQLKKLNSTTKAVSETFKSLQKSIDEIESSPELKQLADANPDIATNARNETAKLHSGDPENQQLWNQILPECLKDLDQVYDKLGVSFDMTLGESFYQPMLANVVEAMTESGIATESDGAKCVFIEGNDAPFIVQKTDGAFTYATTDLATIKYRVDELKADTILYVVDTRQSSHFELLFKTARLWGYENVDFHHINFGTVMGKDRKPYKTRSGATVGLEGLLDEAIARARKIVDENEERKEFGTPLDVETRSAVATAIGIGGAKYADLHINRESDYIFDWDSMLAVTGDTGAYIQYANARIHGIFRKGEIDPDSIQQGDQPIVLTHPAERALVLQLQSFEDVINAVATEYRPHLLTQFLFETANKLTSFYGVCFVLKEPDESIRISRLKLCSWSSRVLTLGLKLLGIEAPKVM